MGAKIGHSVTLETRNKIRFKKLGKRNTKECRRKISISLKGHRVSDETKIKIGAKNKINRMGKKASLITRLKMSLKRRGEKNNLWKGGIYPKNLAIRKSFEYKLWREAVFRRDKYTCIWCGDNGGGNLEADHIKSFSDYPELRFAIDNGRTLCHKCHITTDTYGGKRSIDMTS